MSVATKLTWIAVTIQVLVVLFAVLPDAGPGDPVFTIPDYVFDPLVGVLELDRYLPIGALLVILGFDLSIRVGLFGIWLGSWVWKHLGGG